MGMISDTEMAAISIKPASTVDLPAIIKLLAESELPQAGVGDNLATALVAHAGGEVIGCAALEIHGTAALLRSVAVAVTYRGQGLGQTLTQATLALARQQGITHLYLLTETAANFFLKFGFQPVDRSQVSPAVQNSIEFTTLCPASALAMELRLDQVDPTVG